MGINSSTPSLVRGHIFILGTHSVGYADFCRLRYCNWNQSLTNMKVCFSYIHVINEGMANIIVYFDFFNIKDAVWDKQSSLVSTGCPY